jgi:ATP phosphoribosyltransferase regulatory subunit
MSQHPWLLPEGIDEILPDQAGQLEQLRRDLLDLYASWGYQLVIPPLIEYRDALLTRTDQALSLQTATLTDQDSGRLLGVRADITPQTARIDAHQLQCEAPTRLCYVGSVFQARPSRPAGTRNPLQVGAELYGYAGVAADREVLQLMLETLQLAGIEQVHLDLGHVGIYRALAAQAGLSSEQAEALFTILQRKACADLARWLDTHQVVASSRDMLLALVSLNGDAGVLDQARDCLRAAPPAVHAALDELAQLGANLALPVHYDLAEARTYHYQTGVIFAAFVPGQGYEVARGGRCDQIGAAFGRPRPATGFSTDLKALLPLSAAPPVSQPDTVLAPAVTGDPDLTQKIAALRTAGHVVIQALPDQAGTPAEQGVQRKLHKTAQGWVLTHAA